MWEIWEMTKWVVSELKKIGKKCWEPKKINIPVPTVRMNSGLLRVARGGSGAKASPLAARQALRRRAPRRFFCELRPPQRYPQGRGIL